MYEKITKYIDVFGENAAPAADAIQSFVAEFSQSEFMNPEAMEILGTRGWEKRSALKSDAPTMTAEDACACISAFVMQESFCEGIILDLIQQGVLLPILKRLKELDG